MTIKMKDIFKLPMGANYSGIHEDIKFNGDKIIGQFDTDPEARAATIAINAYDANQLEISKLKTGIRGIEIHAKSMGVTITEQQQEIAELKAMVNEQENMLAMISKNDDYMSQLWFDCGYHKNLDSLLSKTRNQHLASVKADAVDEFIKSYINVKAMDGHGDEAEDVSNYAGAYNKLKEQNTGE